MNTEYSDKCKRMDEWYCNARQTFPEDLNLLMQAKEYDVLVREWYEFLLQWKDYLPNKVIEHIDTRVRKLQFKFYEAIEEASEKDTDNE